MPPAQVTDQWLPSWQKLASRSNSLTYQHSQMEDHRKVRQASDLNTMQATMQPTFAIPTETSYALYATSQNQARNEAFNHPSICYRPNLAVKWDADTSQRFAIALWAPLTSALGASLGASNAGSRMSCSQPVLRQSGHQFGMRFLAFAWARGMLAFKPAHIQAIQQTRVSCTCCRSPSTSA